MLVCRVALGHHVRTHANGRGATSVDEPAQRIFPVSFRELAAVPGITPPVHYHALLADVLGVGARYREVTSSSTRSSSTPSTSSPTSASRARAGRSDERVTREGGARVRGVRAVRGVRVDTCVVE